MNPLLYLLSGPLRRIAAMVVKEGIQLRRDRVTFVTIVMIPLLQLLLFGFAINNTPRHLPTAVVMQESSDVGRAILAALKNTSYFDVTHQPASETAAEALMRGGKVLFVIEIPAGFERRLRRGERPALLIAADATDPVAAGSALAALDGAVAMALKRERFVDQAVGPPFTIQVHRRYNPAGSTPINIVPGLLGTILTITLMFFTALSVTRETERGTMESLLAMPIRPVEIMLGKIIPYVIVGAVQAVIILGAGYLVFRVPMEGNMALLAVLTLVFITANLAIGYTFSSIARNQLQAVQMTSLYFMPNMLLSGFMFPFAGMPVWAQWIGETLPLTHYLRIVRGLLLKDATLADLQGDALLMAGLMLAAMAVAVLRFRQTLD